MDVFNQEQKDEIFKILEDTWRRHNSADEAFDLIEDIIYEIIDTAMRSV